MEYHHLKAAVIFLFLLAAGSPFVESFTFNRADHKFVGRWQRSTTLYQRINDELNERSNQLLQFDLKNILSTDLSHNFNSEKKVSALSSIIKSCNNILEQRSENVSNREIRNLPGELSSISIFINTSYNARDHRSCFKVFNGQDKISLPPNVLMSMSRPFTFLRDCLSYQSDSSEKKKGGMMSDGSEAVVWCSLPGDQDFNFCSSVMDDMPYAQLHLGVDHGDEYLNVELDVELVNKLDELNLLCNDQRSSKHSTQGQYRIKTDELNLIETMISNKAFELEQQTIMKMIDAAVDFVRRDPLNESNEPHLVLLAHCASCSLVASAIAKWKEEQLQNSQSLQRIEDLLQQAVTVVTFGNVCRSFCDGPAYIHISMYDDPWTNALGVHSSNEQGGGKNAVYFHAWSPFDQDDTVESQQTLSVDSLKSHNAHNLNACLIQYLCLIMRINGIQSFRALYDSARFVDPTAILDINPKHFAVNYSNHGELVIPPRIDDELLPAMICATGGDKWLWDDGDQPSTDFDGVLPDEIEARSHLEESFGYSVFEEIQVTCGRQKVVK